MPLPQRKSLVAGVVVASIALGLLFSMVILYLVQWSRRPRTLREAELSQAYAQQKHSLGA
jgi:uncharacterized protein (DUF2062 family)